MKKSQLTLNDITESGFKILEVLTDRTMVSQIAIRTGLSNTTIRRLLQRLEVFGLVEDVFIDQAKHFTLTKDGRSFVKQINKTKLKLNKDKEEQSTEQIQTLTYVEPKREGLSNPESFDLSAWLLKKAQGLRLLSDELTVMAYDLRSYEE